MMSPGISANASESLLICSATDQIMFFRSELCFVCPFTLSQIAPSVKWATLGTGCNGPSGAERSKLLPISHGFFSSPIARWRSRRGLTRRHQLDRIRGLLEEERRFACRVRAHLARVRRVVAPDAINAAHRKHVF